MTRSVPTTTSKTVKNYLEEVRKVITKREWRVAWKKSSTTMRWRSRWISNYEEVVLISSKQPRWGDHVGGERANGDKTLT